MRLGRAQPFTSTHSYLRGPTKVLPLPTLREQTVKVFLVARDTRRRQPRYMPLQGWEGSRTATTGFKVSTLGTIERLLGPEPPEVILAGPPQYLQTITVRCQAIRSRRDLKRRVPPMWREPAETRVVPGVPQTLGTYEPAIGPMPPQVITPPPPPVESTVRVHCAPTVKKARVGRRMLRPAFLAFPPHEPIEIRLAAVQRRTSQRARTARRLLRPPVLRFAYPTPLRVYCVPRRQDWRRYVLRILWAPAIVRPPYPVETTIHTHTVGIERRLRLVRHPQHVLGAPLYVPQPTFPEGALFRTLMGVGK